jgi:hypothetical protein
MNKWIRMTAVGAFLPVLMMVSFLTLAGAPPELAGEWQGKLAVDPKTTLTVKFTFAKDAKGAYTAVLDSPDNPALKNTPVTGVTWDGTTLKMQVPSLQGSYAGTLKGNALNGQWTQPGSNLALVLAPYAKPVVTKAAAAQINGAWMGEVPITPQNKLMSQFRFKSDDKGNVTGTFSIPDQGLNDAPVTDIEFADGKLTLRIPQVRNAQFVGTLANNQLNGLLKISGPGIPPDGLPLSYKRGEYKAAVQALKLTAEQFAVVNGKWQGSLEITRPDGQKNTLAMVLRFQTNENGQYVGFIDSPTQRATNIAVSDAVLANGELSFKVASIAGEYKGKVDGGTITGEWSQGGGGIRVPLVLKRQ